jgi:hypothetical protein
MFFAIPCEEQRAYQRDSRDGAGDQRLAFAGIARLQRATMSQSSKPEAYPFKAIDPDDLTIWARRAAPRDRYNQRKRGAPHVSPVWFIYDTGCL